MKNIVKKIKLFSLSRKLRNTSKKYLQSLKKKDLLRDKDIREAREVQRKLQITQAIYKNGNFGRLIAEYDEVLNQDDGFLRAYS